MFDVVTTLLQRRARCGFNKASQQRVRAGQIRLFLREKMEVFSGGEGREMMYLSGVGRGRAGRGRTQRARFTPEEMEKLLCDDSNVVFSYTSFLKKKKEKKGQWRK